MGMEGWFPALCSLLGTLGGILVSSKLTAYRLEQLEKKGDKHNNLVERMARVEQRVDNIEKDI